MFFLLIIAFLFFLLIVGIIVFKIEKNNISPMDKKLSRHGGLAWLPELVNVGGTIVGIVLTAVGGVMFLNTALKVYVFGFESNSYFNAEEQCRNEDTRLRKTAMPEEEASAPQEMTEEEITQCIKRKTKSEKESYRQRQYEQMIDGFAFLLVGAFLWIVHRRKRRSH